MDIAWATLRNAIAGFATRSTRVVLVGDSLIDRWILGSLERVSPDAPCPVLRVDSRLDTPGGAGNISRQLGHLNISVCFDTLCSREQVPALRVKRFSPLVDLEIAKRIRCVARGQIIFRADEDDKCLFNLSPPILAAAQQAIAIHIGNLLPGAEALIIADYGKGTLSSALVRQIVNRGSEVLTIGCPKPGSIPLCDFIGCRVIQVNAKEAMIFADTDALSTASAIIASKTGAETVVITRGESNPLINGTFANKDAPLPAVPFAPWVCGAGNCFTAWLTAGLLAGIGAEWAATFAHIAGRIYVNQPFSVPVTLDDMNHYLQKELRDENLHGRRNGVGKIHAGVPDQSNLRCARS